MFPTRRFAMAVALLVTLISVLAGGSGSLQAQSSGPLPGIPATEAPSAPQAVGPWRQVMLFVHQQQQALHRQLAQAVRQIKTDGSAQATFGLIVLSLLYGIFHAAGPGHGKAVISSYLLATESAVKRGVALAFLSSFAQALSAILLVVVLALVLSMSGFEVSQSIGGLERASYALVALVGAVMLWMALRPSRRRSAQDHHDHHHNGDAHECGHNHLPDPQAVAGPWSLSKTWAIVLAVGIRPCTGAVLVLLFALTHGLFLAGIGATFAMSLGTAVTVSALAILTLLSKRLATAWASGSGKWVAAVGRVFSIGGALALLLLGLSLFFVSMAPQTPF